MMMFYTFFTNQLLELISKIDENLQKGVRKHERLPSGNAGSVSLNFGQIFDAHYEIVLGIFLKIS